MFFNLFKRITGTNSQTTKETPQKPHAVTAPDSNDQVRKANRKGELGEYKIDIQFNRLPQGYRYLNDLLIKTDWGYSQIDHVVINPAGIFVVETKNYFGTIFGRKDDKTWTICCGKKKLRPYNPIKQNLTHIKVLQSVLNQYRGFRTYSVVSFTKRCDLRGVDLSLKTTDSDVMVVYDLNIFDFITKKTRLVIERDKKPPLCQTDIDAIYDTLSRANIQDATARAEHIRQIQQRNK